MKCPICQRPVKLQFADFPFCSERCKDVDLGNWADEKYVFSTPVEYDVAFEEQKLENLRQQEDQE